VSTVAAVLQHNNKLALMVNVAQAKAKTYLVETKDDSSDQGSFYDADSQDVFGDDYNLDGDIVIIKRPRLGRK